MVERATESKRGPKRMRRRTDRATTIAELLTDHARASAKGMPWFTPEGVRQLQRLVGELSGRVVQTAPELRPLPRWNGESGELWLGDRLLHQFKKAAPALMPILGWAVDHVLNPLPREPGESDDEYRRRVENAAKNLNRLIPKGTLHFRPTLGRTGVRWEYAVARKRRPRRRL